MAGRFINGAYINGFDYENAASQIYDIVGSGNQGSPSSATTRFGSGQSSGFAAGLTSAINLQVQLGTIFTGFAVDESAYPTSGWSTIFQWYDSTTGTVQVSLQYNAQGALGFFRGSGTGTQLGSSSPNGIIQLNNWPFLEMKIVFSATVGTVALYAWGPNGNNGVSTVISATGLNTAPSGNAWCDRVYLFGGTGQAFFDDLYMLDNTGSAPANTYLGIGRAQTDAATSDATPNQFTSSDSQTVGNHYKDVNQLPFSSDAHFLFDSASGDVELFGFPALTAAQVIIINEVIRTELDAAGSRTIETELESSAATQFGTAFQPSTAFGFYNTISIVDPNTGNPWASGTVTAAQNAKLGVKIVS